MSDYYDRFFFWSILEKNMKRGIKNKNTEKAKTIYFFLASVMKSASTWKYSPPKLENQDIRPFYIQLMEPNDKDILKVSSVK